MAILFGIDGTGASDLNEYDKDTEDSFVNRLCGRKTVGVPVNRIPVRLYERGPDLPGFRMSAAIQSGLSFINQCRNAGNSAPIVLTGHSRGAAGVVVVAQELAKQNIPVRALLLFDCVDRHLAIDSSVIPTSVEKVLHIRRHPHARSRESFGNSGTHWHPPTHYEARYFMGTHGGMGGTYWKPKIKNGRPEHSMNDIINERFPDFRTTITYQQDRDNSSVIWGFVQPFLRQNGFIR